MRASRLGLACLALALAPGVVAADNCGDPADCEQTAGYATTVGVVGGLIALASGLLGGSIGSDSPPGPPAGPGGRTRRRGPRLIDPDTGEPLIVHDGTYEGGEPGQVWSPFGGWVDAETAAEHVRIREAERAARQREIDAFNQETERRSEGRRQASEAESAATDAARASDRAREAELAELLRRGQGLVDRVRDPVEQQRLQDFLDRHRDDPDALRRALGAIRRQTFEAEQQRSMGEGEAAEAEAAELERAEQAAAHIQAAAKAGIAATGGAMIAAGATAAGAMAAAAAATGAVGGAEAGSESYQRGDSFVRAAANVAAGAAVGAMEGAAAVGGGLPGTRAGVKVAAQAATEFADHLRRTGDVRGALVQGAIGGVFAGVGHGIDAGLGRGAAGQAADALAAAAEGGTRATAQGGDFAEGARQGLTGHAVGRIGAGAAGRVATRASDFGGGQAPAPGTPPARPDVEPAGRPVADSGEPRPRPGTPEDDRAGILPEDARAGGPPPAVDLAQARRDLEAAQQRVREAEARAREAETAGRERAGGAGEAGPAAPPEAARGATGDGAAPRPAPEEGVPPARAPAAEAPAGPARPAPPEDSPQWVRDRHGRPTHWVDEQGVARDRHGRPIPELNEAVGPAAGSGPPTSRPDHAGEGGWSPEALSRMRENDFYVWRDGRLERVTDPGVIDQGAPRRGVLVQVDRRTGRQTVLSWGEGIAPTERAGVRIRLGRDIPGPAAPGPAAAGPARPAAGEPSLAGLERRPDGTWEMGAEPGRTGPAPVTRAAAEPGVPAGAAAPSRPSRVSDYVTKVEDAARLRNERAQAEVIAAARQELEARGVQPPPGGLHAAHLRPNDLGGSGGPENLVAVPGTTNLSHMAVVENYVRGELAAGSRVHMDVQARFPDPGTRVPDAIEYRITVEHADGRTEVVEAVLNLREDTGYWEKPPLKVSAIPYPTREGGLSYARRPLIEGPRPGDPQPS